MIITRLSITRQAGSARSWAVAKADKRLGFVVAKSDGTFACIATEDRVGGQNLHLGPAHQNIIEAARSLASYCRHAENLANDNPF